MVHYISAQSRINIFTLNPFIAVKGIRYIYGRIKIHTNFSQEDGMDWAVSHSEA